MNKYSKDFPNSLFQKQPSVFQEIVPIGSTREHYTGNEWIFYIIFYIIVNSSNDKAANDGLHYWVLPMNTSMHFLLFK